MVGRGMAPVNLEAGKLEQELTELKSRMLNEKQEAAVSAEAGQTEEKPQLGFYEALKNPGKETAFQPAKPAQSVGRKPTAAKPAAPTAKPRPPATPSPDPVSKPKPKPPSAPKTASGSRPDPAMTAGDFSVQVASVQDIKGADRMVAELRAKGYQAYLIRSDVAGKGIWYRIRVGGFDDRSAAANMLKKLKNDKYGGMVVNTK
jgi:cell division septation protein DedD